MPYRELRWWSMQQLPYWPPRKSEREAPSSCSSHSSLFCIDIHCYTSNAWPKLLQVPNYQSQRMPFNSYLSIAAQIHRASYVWWSLSPALIYCQTQEPQFSPQHIHLNVRSRVGSTPNTMLANLGFIERASQSKLWPMYVAQPDSNTNWTELHPVHGHLEFNI